MLLYHYCYGDEDVLGSRIKVIQDLQDFEIYTITFEQEGINPDWFKDINVGKYRTTIISKKTEECEDVHVYKRLITLKVKGINNPKPEKLFKVSEQKVSVENSDIVEPQIDIFLKLTMMIKNNHFL